MSAAGHEHEAAAWTMLQRLFDAVRSKADRFATHLHPGWIDAALPDAWPQVARPGCAGRASRQGSRLLAQAYGVRWPDLTSLRTRTHRVALLAREPLLQVLAVTALCGRSGDVRRCVAKPARQALIALVGEPAYAALLRLPDAGRPTRPLVAAELQPHTLAAEGHRMLLDRGLWHCRNAALITRLSLPPGAVRRAPTTASSAAQGDPVGPFDRMDSFFPELTWMFGSDMDRALSDSPTA